MDKLESGWFRPKKLTVEACLDLNINELNRKGVLKRRNYRGRFRWADQADNEILVLPYEIMSVGKRSRCLRVTYLVESNGIPYPAELGIRLTTTKLVSGGSRWWFECPKCNKRMGKLYLPPGENAFACRLCYNLTYQSNQRESKFEALTGR
jgi:hypothetical protein